MKHRLLSLALRGLITLQRRRLGPLQRTVVDAAQLRLSEEESRAEHAIGALRRQLARDTRILRVTDHGAGTRGIIRTEAKPAGRRVANIYRRAAATPAWGRFLFRLTRALQPRRVLELGTSLGVSAAHISAALEMNEMNGGARGHLVTLEGDPAIADLARAHLDELGQGARVEVVTGRFSDVLPAAIRDYSPFDLVFLDGHHEETATQGYWRLLRGALTPGACVAFDDIEPGRSVRRAWKQIVAAETMRGARVVDLVGLGLLFMPDSGAGASQAAPANEIGGVVVGQ